MNHRQNGCLKSGCRQRSLLHDCCRHRGCHRRMSCCCCCRPSVRRSCCPKSERAARWMERRCGWAGCWRVRRTRANCSRWSGAQRWCGSSYARLRRLGCRMYGCCRSRPKTAGWLVRQTKSCCCCGCTSGRSAARHGCQTNGCCWKRRQTAGWHVRQSCGWHSHDLCWKNCCCVRQRSECRCRIRRGQICRAYRSSCRCHD